MEAVKKYSSWAIALILAIVVISLLNKNTGLDSRTLHDNQTTDAYWQTSLLKHEQNRNGWPLVEFVPVMEPDKITETMMTF